MSRSNPTPDGGRSTATGPVGTVADRGGHTSSSRPDAGASRPAPAAAGAADRHSRAQPARQAPRRVRLTVSRVDPWSVLKLSFLLSVAVGIAIVVAAVVLWSVLDGMGLFADVNRLTQDVVGDEATVDVLDLVGLGRVLSLATVVAVVDVVLITAISTLAAFLYNVTASLVGGLQVTLSDD